MNLVGVSSLVPLQILKSDEAYKSKRPKSPTVAHLGEDNGLRVVWGFESSTQWAKNWDTK